MKFGKKKSMILKFIPNLGETRTITETVLFCYQSVIPLEVSRRFLFASVNLQKK